MSGNLNLSDRRSTSATEIVEVYSPQEDLRPGNEFLTDVSTGDEEYCVIRCTLPAGAVVPMHSHADRETFYVLSGTVDALRGDQWQQLEPGDVFDVRYGTRHAWRNSSQAPASMICVTTTRLARFLREVSVPVDGAFPEEPARRFLRLVRDHGYWLANQQENAAVGLDVSWEDLRD
jgi:quercetin dioxygenase-like cupin family protein